MIETIWQVKESTRSVVKELAYELEIPNPVAAVYAARGFSTPESVRDWNEIGLKKLHNPFDMNDIEPFLERMNCALDNKEKIYVFGDYDVDGVTSTAICVTVLKMLGANFEYRVPHRQQDGYDVKRKIVDEAIACGASLMMTVDCGIVAFDAANYAKEQGIDLIITDHHQPSLDGRLPNAIAVINPNRLDNTYPFSGLAGCGISFKIMTALASCRGIKAKAVVEAVIDLAALGTVSDVAPMYDENRTIVKLGCANLANTKKAGIAALLKVARLTGNIDTTSIGFFLGPRINAIGRLADSQTALDLLLETNETRAKFLAQTLESANVRRQELQQQTVDEALFLVKDIDETQRYVVVSAKGWEKGLVGLVAGKIAEHTLRPTLCLTMLSNGFSQGSGRSTRDFDMLSSLKSEKVASLWAWRDGNWIVGLSQDGTKIVAAKLDGNETIQTLEGTPEDDWAKEFLNNRSNCSVVCGGHEFAAGFTVPSFNIDALREELNNYAVSILGNAPIQKILEIDALIRPSHINRETFRAIEEMAPFGSKNPEPVFLATGMYVIESNVLKEKHLKLKLAGTPDELKPISAIAWRRGIEADKYPTGSQVDIVFKLQEDNFMGKTNLSMLIEDVRPHIPL